jgi:hypothetical protein
MRTTMDGKQWERLRYRGTRLKQRVLAQLPDTASGLAGELAWQSFTQHSAEQGNVLPELLARIEPQGPRPGMFKRRTPRKPKGSDPFADLPPSQHLNANLEFERLCRKWEGDLPAWRRAILAGVARRLTVHPPDSEWGRRMRRIKGGVHTQRKYRAEGWHPLRRYSQAMAKRHSSLLKQTDEPGAESEARTAQARERLGITPEPMRGRAKIAPLLHSVEGSIPAVVEALRWSQEPEAVAFLAKYDAIPFADREYLSIDEICVAAGVEGTKLLSVAADSMMKTAVYVAQIHCAVSLPAVARAAIERALGPKGWRDRKLLLQKIGVVPQ